MGSKCAWNTVTVARHDNGTVMQKHDSNRVTILYVDEAFGFGGSTTCMATVVCHLDRSRYDPVIVLSYNDASGQIGAKHFPGVPVLFMARPYVSLSAPGPAGLRRSCARFGWLGDKVLVGAVTLYNLVADFVPRVWRFFCLMRRLRVRVVHANNALCLNQATIIASLLARARLVCHIRSFEQVTRFGRWLFRRADAVVVQSYAQKKDLIRQGLCCEKVHVVHECVWMSEVNVSQKIQTFRSSLGIDGGTLVYGIVGMLTPWKGHRVFLEAAAIIAKELPNGRAVIAGDTITEWDPYGKELRTLAVRLGLGEKVFFTGLCMNTDQVYASLDVVVHCSVSAEPFGRVLIEAMGRGLPVVATRGGGPDEIVVDGKTGLLIPAGDPKALAKAIITLLTDPELRRTMGEAGRERVDKHFRATKQAQEIEAIYERVRKNARRSVHIAL